MKNYQKSQAILQRLRCVTPGGAQTLSKRAERFPEGAFPVALQSGTSQFVTDVDNNTYLDMVCGLASMTLGYPSNEFAPFIDQCNDGWPADKVSMSVIEQIAIGYAFSLATELEAEVAEKICTMIPCAEMVRFVKSGSEATEAAIRVARKATGRDAILTVGAGYHSWHSWFQAVKPEHPGVPREYEQLIRSFVYNDLDSLSMAFDKFIAIDKPEVAAVILEPCHYEAPQPGFLEGVKRLCHKYGALLIFDEMVTGFRWANGGAQEYCNVIPDLATFGKACANGYPLAFLCGRRDIMRHADVVSGTFGGDCIGLAACNAVLDIYKERPIVQTLWQRGEQFQNGIRRVIDNTLLDGLAVCDGYPVKPRIRFMVQDQQIAILAMSLFVQELAEWGVLWHPAGGNISAAMTTGDIDMAIDVCERAFIVVKHAMETGDWSALYGKPIQPLQFVRGGA